MLNYETPPPTSKDQRRTEVMTAFVAVFLLFGCILAPCSGLAFDAPGSDKQPATCLLVYSSMAMPFTCIAGILVSRFFAKQERQGIAQLVLLIPLLNALLWIIGFAWVSARGGHFD
jgi:hypothetical protein